jgi:hypothetical protein
MTTTASITTRVDQFRAEIEDLWTQLDVIFDSLTERDWQRRHGPDWVVADVPYHLSYFDADIVAGPIERGTGEPGPGERLLTTLRELNEWNAQMFAMRPADETPQQSLKRMRASRDRVRAALSRMTDAGLDRPAWSFLAGIGRRTVETLLKGLVAHSWSHLMQLRYFLKRKDAAPSPEATHRALGFYAHLLQFSFERQEAAKLKTPFIVGMEYRGPGGGAWRVRAEESGCTVEEVDPSELRTASVKLTMTPETSIKMFAEITNPMLLMLTRQVRVKGFSRMRTFGKLFPKPTLDRVIDPANISL